MAFTNILLSSAGRRVGLLECFRESISARKSDAWVLAIDHGTSAPAAILADGAAQVPRCTDPDFAETVLQYCADHGVGLVIPTIDTELAVYADARRRFAEWGVSVCVSDPAAVQVCCNKCATHRWLVEHKFPTVRQTNLKTALEHPSAWQLPLIVKPTSGSASIGLRRVQTWVELEALEESEADYIVQEVATGREFTINVYVNLRGECICAVPHWRMEIRAGEVAKGLTVKDRRLMKLASDIAVALPGARGPLNIQCFMDECGEIKVIEINARFGGGYPLTHRAGGRFTDWLLDEHEGGCPSRFDNWIGDLAMLRYDEAVFVSGSRL